MASFGAFGKPSTSSTAQSGVQDVEVVSPPGDGISSLHFSPVANHLVATSWDQQVRCWEISPTGQSAPKLATPAEQPVLCSDWSTDGSTVFYGGCDKSAYMWNLQTNQTQKMAAHDAPINNIFFIKELNMVVTSSWDKTLRYWDVRQSSGTPAHTQQLPERPFAMDVKYPLAVVGLAQRKIQVYNLTNPAVAYKELESPLKWQTRCISCFPDTTGYLIGSIEGRVAVHHVEDNQQSRNFTFKCHRDGNEVYAVTSMCFHPQHGTFVTTGSDGAYNFWDKDSKQRLKELILSRCHSPAGPKAAAPIPGSAFNRDGTMLAYAVSYDWSQGYAAYNPQTAKNLIMLHAPTAVEVEKRNRNAGTGRR